MKLIKVLMFCFGVFTFQNVCSQKIFNEIRDVDFADKEVFLLSNDSSQLLRLSDYFENTKYPISIRLAHSVEFADVELNSNMFFLVPNQKRFGKSDVNYQLSLIRGMKGIQLGLPSENGFYSLHGGIKELISIPVNASAYYGDMDRLYIHSLLRFTKYIDRGQKGLNYSLTEDIYSLQVLEILFEASDIMEKLREPEIFASYLKNGYVVDDTRISELLNDPNDKTVIADCVLEHKTDGTTIAHRYLFNWELGMIWHDESVGSVLLKEKFEPEILGKMNRSMEKNLPEDFARKKAKKPSRRKG